MKLIMYWIGDASRHIFQVNIAFYLFIYLYFEQIQIFGVKSKCLDINDNNDTTVHMVNKNILFFFFISILFNIYFCTTLFVQTNNGIIEDSIKFYSLQSIRIVV